MTCVESPRAQAYLDGELDSLSMADFEEHLQRCARCTRLIADLSTLRDALRRMPRDPAPAALRSRIERMLDEESAPPRESAKRDRFARRYGTFWSGAVSGAGAMAAAAALAFFLLSPVSSERLQSDLVTAHLHSLMASHLLDVESTDRHTVKPWFAGHTEVSPVVADFAADGYSLIGGRLDYIDRQRAAVLVYRHGPHVINVFTWIVKDEGLPRDVTRSGYHLIFWRSGDIAYCAVSDAGWEELNSLQRLIQARARFG